MARKKNNNQLALLVFMVCVGLLFALVSKVADSVNTGAFVAGALLLFAIIIFAAVRQKVARLAYLRTKYEDEEIVRRIVRKQFWEGQTSEQLQDSLGNPHSKDNALLKTKKKEVWKYRPDGRNRYRLRITFNNDVVVGWDQKS